MYNYFICPFFLRSIADNYVDVIHGPLARFTDDDQPYYMCFDSDGKILEEYGQIAIEEKDDHLDYWLKRVCDCDCYQPYKTPQPCQSIQELGVQVVARAPHDRFILTHQFDNYRRPFSEKLDDFNIQLHGEAALRNPQIGLSNHFSHTFFTDKLIQASENLLDVVYGFSDEDIHTDKIILGLRCAGFTIGDQGRGGQSGSGKQTGERDFVVRNSSNRIKTIAEALRIKSCNQTIEIHLTKLISKYDNLGLGRKYFLIYSETEDFNDMWKSYSDYISDINSKREFKTKCLHSFEDTSASNTPHTHNIRTGLSKHSHQGNDYEIFHLFINIHGAIQQKN